MRIILFTQFTPTPDNYRGPSAMMYHFFLERPSDCQVKIYTTNGNGVPPEMLEASRRQLNAEIVVLKDDLYNFFHKRHTLADLRIRLSIDKYYGQSNYRLRKKYLQEIDDFLPDLVWVYDEAYTTVIKQMVVKYKVLVAGYDCFPLHYNRLLRDSYCFISEDNYHEALHKYKVAISRELALVDVPCNYFDVGISDRNMFEMITGRTDAKFYPHPHYNVYPKEVSFNKKKLSILISGKYDQYNWTDTNKLVRSLSLHSELNELYSITFLGKKWTSAADLLRTAAFEVIEKEWVDVYADEVVKHDIQIFPISVGSGTKGKVLDALSMGILCIGSEIALENIYVNNGHSCFQYNDVSEVPNLLSFIHQHRDLCTVIAENGRKQVLKWHNPKRIMSLIMDDLLNDIHCDCIQEYVTEVEHLNPIV